MRAIFQRHNSFKPNESISMPKFPCILLLLLSVAVMAGEAPLPADAQAALNLLIQKEAEIRADADAKIVSLRNEVITQLGLVKDAAMSRNNRSAVDAIRAKITEICAAQPGVAITVSGATSTGSVAIRNIRPAPVTPTPITPVPATPATSAAFTAKDIQSIFGGQAVVNNGVVTLTYTWTPSEMGDWAVTGDNPTKVGNAMAIGPLSRVRHKAQWTGPMTLRGRMSQGNRTGTILGIGALTVTSSSYNAWNIHIANNGNNVGGVKYDGQYTVTSDGKKMNDYIIISNELGVKLSWNGLQVAAAGAVTKGSVFLEGGSSGNLFEPLQISGTLDPMWVQAELQVAEARKAKK